MNAKIKELAEQAWPGLPENWQDSQSGTVIGINEFAELIVRRCARMADCERNRNPGKFILEQFGVEE